LEKEKQERLRKHLTNTIETKKTIEVKEDKKKRGNINSPLFFG
jgi:hypothetical protein